MDQVTAQFRVNSLLWWGGGSALAGYAIRWVVAVTADPGSVTADGARLWFLLGTLVMVAGAIALMIGLVAVGVRLGLAAYAVD